MTALALIALPVSALVILAALRSPLARRLVASPRGDRWHEQVTPSVGGFGIFAGILAGVGLAGAAGVVDVDGALLGILAGCTILFVAGLADDLHSLSPVTKLGAQVAAAVVVIVTGTRVEIVSNPILATTIAVLWLVGMTNAFNLLDNMDGLAATLAAIACGFFAIDALTHDKNAVVATLSLAVAAACVGFLPFNLRLHKPAAVFMGDSGSQVIGFALASLSLVASWKLAGTTVATLLLPILVLAVPILDTALVVIVRLLEGRPIYQGGRDHTSHRLVYYGLSEKRAVAMLALISAGLGATSLGYTVLPDTRLTAIGVLLTFVLLIQFGSFLAQVERGPVASPPGGSLLARTVLVHRRRLVEVLVDAALFTSAFLAAYLFRIHDTGTPWDSYVFNVSLPVIMAARYLAFIVFGLYRSVWRFAGARDALAIVSAVLLSEAVAVGFLAATQDWKQFPRAVFVLDALFCIFLVGASRFAERGLFRTLLVLRGRSERHRAVVIGAGRAGRSLLRELNETAGEQVVGFVDDDPRLWGRRLQGVRVLGGADEIDRVLAQTHPDAVLVTIPNAPRDRLDPIVSACARAGIDCRFVRRELDLAPAAVLGRTAE